MNSNDASTTTSLDDMSHGSAAIGGDTALPQAAMPPDTSMAPDMAGPLGTNALPDLAARRETIRQLHRNERAYFLFHNAMSLGYLALMALAVWTWMHGYWPLTILVWAIAGHIGHSKLIAFHEASHGTLNRRWLVNEIQGIGVGTIILVPLSVYRYVHGQHHTYLASPRDLELWPFVVPSAPRWARLLAAGAELFVGFFYTPILFLHGVWVGDNIPPDQRRRIIWEYAICGVFWAGLLAVLWRYGWWEQFLVGYLVPASIAGNLQSVRKFTEHLGLRGDSILTVTRTVVDPSMIGTFLSESMLHIDFHGTHHRYAKMPHYNLPEATPLVYEEVAAKLPIFPTYRAAMLDMARGLGDPRIGPHWDSPSPVDQQA